MEIVNEITGCNSCEFKRELPGWDDECKHPYWDNHNGYEDMELGYHVPSECPLRKEDLIVINKVVL